MLIAKRQLIIGMFAAAVCLTGFSAESASARGAAWEPGPCTADVAQHCANVQKGGGAIRKCIKDNIDKVSEGCRQHVADRKQAMKENRKSKMAAGREACAGDISKLCANVPPMGGGVWKCLKANAASLSAGCKAAVESSAKPW